MKFETPNAEIIYLDPQDIVTASMGGSSPEAGEFSGPGGPSTITDE